MSGNIDLKNLTARIKQSDMTAFRDLFSLYCRSLVFYVNDILRQSDATEDIVQDVFLKIWEKRHELEPDRSIQSLLYTIAYRLALNHIRDSHKNVNLNEHHEMIRADNPPDILFEKNERNQKIFSIIDQLPHQTRIVFKMSRVEELSYKEIAARLFISVKTVESHIGKALKILRKNLSE